jgi:probable HAF family extracellular repeat protein
MVAGISVIGGFSWHAFRASASGGMEDLGALPTPPGRTTRSFVADINRAGVVVGWSPGWREGWLAEMDRAVRWVPGEGIEDLGAIGDPAPRKFSQALAINDRGQITGSAVNDAGDRNAFLWNEGEGMRDLGRLNGNFSQGTLINEQGHVAGTDGRFGFFWSPETGMIDLGTLPDATGVEPLAMNDRDQIVGRAVIGLQNDNHAFLWTPEGGMVDLGALAEYPETGRSRAIAYDINDRSEVVGWSAAENGFFHAFYLQISSPTPESVTQELIDVVIGLDLSKGRETALLASLKNALKKIEEGDFETAAEMIGAFISKVEAQRGKSITEEDADALIAMAQEVLDLMNAA